MISSVLIANRGEIACRIIRACRGLNLRTVAVYSDADAQSMHKEMADVAVHIGAAPAAQSYLDAGKVLAAGRAAGADAVHPGYGFLSENTSFARAAAAAGLTWIGPDPDTIDAMGNKARARQIAKDSGVPVLPGSGRLDPDHPSSWQTEAQAVGYPLLVKAVGGGGGIGMKRVDGPADLHATIESAQTLALKAFGQPEVYLERYIVRARHIEIQVFGWGNGEVVHLFERECSVQRRFQKIIEESPAPGLASTMVAQMADAAIALARAQRYSGAGTVEFIVDADTKEFFFLEMNTRIQVEHAVTEMITGWDLVQEQINVAAGLCTPRAQTDIQRHGAAIECRLYAENPAKNFFPSPGPLTRFSLPSASLSLRVDCGVREGDKVTPYYDPMIAKLIAYGADRTSAVDNMEEALRAVHITGLHHNASFLRAVLAHPQFRAGEVDTSFVERERAALMSQVGSDDLAAKAPA